MRSWREDYDDAFDDAYDDYGDDDEEEESPSPRKTLPQVLFLRGVSAGDKDKVTQTRRPPVAKNSQPPQPMKQRKGAAAKANPSTILNEAEAATSSTEIPPPPTSTLLRRPPSDFRLDPQLEKLCQSMEGTTLSERQTLHLVILGHVDAGKSTLMGRLLHDLGRVDKRTRHKHEKEASEAGKASFSWAWVLDERPEERERGVTIDVATSYFQTEKLNVVLLDAPGHRDFVPNMIAGAAQADAAILAVDGSVGGFEAGFETGRGPDSVGGGQTREHARLAKSLGIDQIAVAITKLDTCGYSQERFVSIQDKLMPFLLRSGFKADAIEWLICSAPDGVNVTEAPKEPELAWYQGMTVLQAIDRFRPIERSVNAPLRLVVGDVTRTQTLGSATVGGKIEAGAVKVLSSVSILPSGESATIKGIELNGERRQFAKAGESCEIGLAGIDPGILYPGCVLCSVGWPCSVASLLECRVQVLEPRAPILPGLQISLQAHAVQSAGQITCLISLLDPKSGEVTRMRPRCLTQNQMAVVEVKSSQPMCVETYRILRPLGRITLRESGRTIAIGIISKIA